jgi:murein DD-endopeptidase MepM/ murein hydrolase activator NlpD
LSDRIAYCEECDIGTLSAIDPDMKKLIGVAILLLLSLPNALCADIRIMWDDEKKFEYSGGGSFLLDPLVEFTEEMGSSNQLFIMPADGRMSSMFGWRRDPFDGSTKLHSGIDIANIRSSDVRSSADGVISFAGYAGGCGVMVVVEHRDDFDTRYCHLGRALKYIGESVAVGEPIGLMGATGRSTGVHLHFEMRRAGEAVDPAQYLALMQ